ncbi:hypothetical protein FA10DRAFT_241235, partial [Acaromyces ingoldii]
MTGETVAVKQIHLAAIPSSELGEIMSEIDLLKNLNHPKIVKYKGSEKTRDFLYIILEYCENGSLQNICRRFGKFPEGLVGVYILQVLEGLVYLHDQGVIHRDIKGANILTTKDGSVKLADFGVATKTTALSNGSVVGSPYWMAPEVIDQSGATTASDVWSVGCVVIELLEGKPPYHFLDPMPALFRIVQDDCPPLPEGASPIVKDFLMHCFQKDVNLRISARKLSRHPWMMSARKQLEQMRPAGMGAAGTGSAHKGDRVGTGYDEAVKSVQQWNEALKAAGHQTTETGSVGSGEGAHSAAPAPPAPSHAAAAAAANADTSMATSRPAPVVSLLDQQQKKLDQLNTPEEQTDNWDDDFEEDITTTKIAAAFDKGTPTATATNTAAPNSAPLSLAASTLKSTLNGSNASKTFSDSAGEVEDYSDLFEDEEEFQHLDERVKKLKQQNSIGRRLFHPKDLRTIAKERGASDNKQTVSSSPLPGGASSSSGSSSSTTIHNKNTRVPLTKTTAVNGADLKKTGQDKQTQKKTRRALGSYSEAEGEGDDYSDLVVGAGDAIGSAAGMGASSPNQTLQLTTRLSKRSWLGDDDSDEDPFAEFEDDFSQEADLEANVARDKHARMCASVNDLVEELQATTSEDQLIEACEQLESILTDMPDMKSQIFSAHGALAIIQLLEEIQIRDVISRLLGLLNVIIYQDAVAQENLCLIGSIPVVMQFTSKKFPHDVRIEAAHFVFAMCSTSSLTLQFVLSCRGLKTLVELIDEDYWEQRDLVWLGVGCVNSVLELQSPASRNDFCRMLAQEGLLEPLTTALVSVLDDESGDEYAASAKAHILQTLHIYSGSDSWLKRQLATRGVLRRMLHACQKLEPASLTLMLKVIKNLSMSPSILDELQNCNAIETLVRILSQHHDGPYGTEMSNQVLNAMYNLCRLNKPRQEEAAQAGLIPQLLRIARTASPLRQFALPILCDFAHAGKSTRKMLNQQGGLDFYLKLLEDPYWQAQALEAILVWLQEDTARVEDVLLRPSSIASLLFVFSTSKANSFENLLEPFTKIFRLSTGVTLALGRQSAFIRRLIDRLSHTKAVVRLSLLRITKLVCDVHPDRQGLIEQYKLLEIIESLSRNDAAVLVRELAREI